MQEVKVDHTPLCWPTEHIHAGSQSCHSLHSYCMPVGDCQQMVVNTTHCVNKHSEVGLKINKKGSARLACRQLPVLFSPASYTAFYHSLSEHSSCASVLVTSATPTIELSCQYLKLCDRPWQPKAQHTRHRSECVPSQHSPLSHAIWEAISRDPKHYRLVRH